MVLPFLGLLACSDQGITKAEPESSGGQIKKYEFTLTEGSYDLLQMDGSTIGTAKVFLSDGQFLLPTLVVDYGDTLEVTIHNESTYTVSLHPHGVHYDEENEGVDDLVVPGASRTYVWQATDGTGTFLYHSHQVDATMLEYQGLAGVLGVIVIQDPAEVLEQKPTHMLNFVMTNTYTPWTTLGSTTSATGSDTGSSHNHGSTGTVHNHTMVMQEVRGGVTNTIESLVSSATLGQTVRVNVVGFGETYHTFHTHGFTWTDLWTGRLLDTISVGPGESYYFYLPLDNPGTWMVHCHVDSHLHMMTGYIDVNEPQTSPD